MKKTLITLLLSTGVLCVQAQTTCATAVTVHSGSYYVTYAGGSQVPDPICALNGPGATMGAWYRYTATVDTTVTVSTVASGLDTRFHVYTGSCGALVCYAGDDDSGPNYTSIASFQVFAGNSYTIAFDNRWNSSSFTFVLTETAPIIPPPPPQGTVTFSSAILPGVQGSTFGVVDMNGDFLDDVVSVSGTNINILRQQSNGTLAAYNYPTSNVNNVASWSMSAGDLDNNGYNDLQYGAGGGVTYMMANNYGTAYTAVNFPQYVFSQRGNMVDINNDGALDAFMCHDVDANVYYLNDGSGNLSFAQGGLGPDCGNYGSVWVDYDNDGDLDLFIAKCGCDPVDILMRNNGDGTFTSMAAALGFADNQQSWSSAWGDFDNDGDMDVLVGFSSNNDHKLMRNNGDGTFTNVTLGSGFDTFTGTSIEWNTRDFNNDGWLDIIGGGAIHYNNGNMTFSADNTAPDNGAIGDLNNDGFLDIVNYSGAWMNNGNDNHWITVDLVGTVSNRNGIGAKVKVTSALGTQEREIRSGDGFKYMSSLNAHFGIGEDSVIDQVEVKWPSGITDIVHTPNIDGRVTITEGTTGTTGITDSGADAGLGVYPNPATNLLTVASTAGLRNNLFTILDVTGKRVMQGRLLGDKVDVSQLTGGIYVLSVVADGKSVQHRFVKQ